MINMTIQELNAMKDEMFDRYFGDMFPEYAKLRKEVKNYKTRCINCGGYIKFSTNVCSKREDIIDFKPVMVLKTTVKCPCCGHYKSVKFEERA